MKKAIPVIVLCGLVILGLISCGIDPWTTGSPTNVIGVTKITKFAKEKDGVTPMKSQVGKVRMSHRAHMKDAGLKCIDCHHKTGNDARIKTCAAAGCHTADNVIKGKDGYETMHGKCLDCHIARKNGIEKCKQCH